VSNSADRVALMSQAEAILRERNLLLRSPDRSNVWKWAHNLVADNPRLVAEHVGATPGTSAPPIRCNSVHELLAPLSVGSPGSPARR
jgi:hypothetical protein